MNFHCWAKSLRRLVERTHGKKDDFGTEDNDPDSKRNAEIRTYIKKYIAVDLSNSIKEEDKGKEEKTSTNPLQHPNQLSATCIQPLVWHGQTRLSPQSFFIYKVDWQHRNTSVINRRHREASNRQLKFLSANSPKAGHGIILAHDSPSCTVLNGAIGFKTANGRRLGYWPSRTCGRRIRIPSWRSNLSSLTHGLLKSKLTMESLSYHPSKRCQETPSKQHLVVGKDIINWACPSGNFRLTEVLHFPDIPGTMLSIGKFVRNDGAVKFEEGLFKLIQNSCMHYSSLKGNRWFLLHVPGDMVVTDLIGLFPVSMDKKVYALLVQDHYSSLATFYPLKAKSEAANFVIEWIKKFNNLTKYTVKRLRSDNGGEFLFQLLKEYLESKGIIYERTILYEHHQAGKIERMNRTIAKAARSISKRLVVLGAWEVFDENKGQAIKGRIPRVSKIQIQNIFDLSMIREIRYQDEQVKLMNVSASLHSDAPGSYGEVLALDDQQKWKEAISTKIARMERWRCGWRYQRIQHPRFWAQDGYSRSRETQWEE
ncbi:hypothetical protein O181_051194 [Austropuccinia psidii MF-1]|uniref:Integrase catalytic domain-containing protein n=1 Tax=Austropuccinia psidii MF-1 TaxID=1389203 RepID=A0A9Q3HQG2_9BASI|nr:hypothetical protein [Austropuccinia psidii MF-1]